MKIAVDFDGVIYQYDGRYRGGELPGQPVDGAVEALGYLSRRHVIIVFSMRGRAGRTRQLMAEWLDNHNIPYHSIARFKPDADVYLDDKAIRFVSWSDALEKLEELSNGKCADGLV